MELTKLRADQLKPGEKFFAEAGGKLWIRTAKLDPDNRVPSFALDDLELTYFGEAQTVLRLEGECPFCRCAPLNSTI